jgi:hypothetical protein
MKFTKGVVVGALIAIASLVATAAYAGSGIGAVFNIGKTNTVNGTSTLTGSTAGAQLKVANASTATGATGMYIQSATGKPPFVVSSKTQVPRLNASLLDGEAASAFLPVGGTAANASKLGGQTASQVESAARVGLFSHVTNYDATQLLSAGQQATLDELCPDGTVAIGGSVNIIPDGDGTIQVSRPDGDTFGDSPDNGGALVGWRGIATATNNDDVIDVHAYCAS